MMMWAIKCLPTLSKRLLCQPRHVRNVQSFVVSDEVRCALREHTPLVALESTIITHGMPWPANFDTATQVEAIVRKEGAVPATIAVVEGKVHVGLSTTELEALARAGNKMKISRRDLAYAVSQRVSGGTTVSATMLIAARAGIKIFATGGCGGVHRGAESTMDISADLIELSRTNVAVVSSGIKSILDIGKSLEYLETHGVPIITLADGETGDLRNVQFPAFFTRRSRFVSPMAVPSVRDAAQLLLTHHQLKLENGMLIAVPIPAEHEATGDVIDKAIEQALDEASRDKVSGRDITPYILKRVVELTGGESLIANTALIKNNAKTAAKIAVEYSKLQTPGKPVNRKEVTANYSSEASRPIVVGGSIIDVVIRTESKELQLNGATFHGHTTRSLGGVGRNLADGLAKLGHNVLFLTAVGDDVNGHDVINANDRIDKHAILVANGASTAACFVLIDGRGDCKLYAGDFDVHRHITTDYVRAYCAELKRSPFVVIDANIPIETLDYVMRVCRENHVLTWYEPTDLNLAHKILSIDSDNLKAINYTSPNLSELQTMASAINSHREPSKHSIDANAMTLEQALTTCEKLATPLLELCANMTLLVTLSAHGAALITKSRSGHLVVEHIRPPKIDHKEIVNVSGAGDCMTAAVISGLICNKSLRDAIEFANQAAAISLRSRDTVPNELSQLSLPN